MVKNNTAFTVIKNIFQTFRTIFSSSSVISKIKQLKPYHWLILDITDDELNIVRNVWNMFLITVKAVLFLTKIDKSAVYTVPRFSNGFS